MRTSRCKLCFGYQPKDALVEEFKTIIGIHFVNFDPYSWTNCSDTAVFYFEKCVMEKDVLTLIKLHPDECHTQRVKGRLIWRLWWD